MPHFALAAAVTATELHVGPPRRARTGPGAVGQQRAGASGGSSGGLASLATYDSDASPDSDARNRERPDVEGTSWPGDPAGIPPCSRQGSRRSGRSRNRPAAPGRRYTASPAVPNSSSDLSAAPQPTELLPSQAEPRWPWTLYSNLSISQDEGSSLEPPKDWKMGALGPWRHLHSSEPPPNGAPASYLSPGRHGRPPRVGKGLNRDGDLGEK